MVEGAEFYTNVWLNQYGVLVYSNPCYNQHSSEILSKRKNHQFLFRICTTVSSTSVTSKIISYG